MQEWAAAQAAAGYLAYDPASGRFHLTEEQAFALADPDGPLYLPGAFQLALASLRAEPRIGVPNALSQQPTAVLGNQAGEARTRELAAAGGFSRFRRAAQTPFNLVDEARP